MPSRRYGVLLNKKDMSLEEMRSWRRMLAVATERALRAMCHKHKTKPELTRSATMVLIIIVVVVMANKKHKSWAAYIIPSPTTPPHHTHIDNKIEFLNFL